MYITGPSHLPSNVIKTLDFNLISVIHIIRLCFPSLGNNQWFENKVSMFHLIN